MGKFTTMKYLVTLDTGTTAVKGVLFEKRGANNEFKKVKNLPYSTFSY